MKIWLLPILFLILQLDAQLCHAQNASTSRYFNAQDNIRPFMKTLTDGQGFQWMLPRLRTRDDLVRYDGTQFKTIPNLTSFLIDARVFGDNYFDLDESDVLWKCGDNGIVRMYNGQVQRHYKVSDGLLSDTVYSMSFYKGGGYFLTKHGIVFIPIKDELPGEPTVVFDAKDSNFIQEFDKVKGYSRILFSADSLGVLWWAVYNKNDTTSEIDYHKVARGENGSFQTIDYAIKERFTGSKRMNEGILLESEAGYLFLLGENGEVEKLDQLLNDYLGEDDRGRVYFTVRDGNFYNVVRDSVSSITDVDPKNPTFYRYPSIEKARIYNSFKINGKLCFKDRGNDQYYVLEEKEWIDLASKYPDLRIDKNLIIGDGGQDNIWSWKHGIIGASSLRFYDHIWIYKNEKEPNGMHAPAINFKDDIVYIADDGLGNIFLKLNLKSGKYEPLSFPEVDFQGTSQHRFKSLDNGNAWLRITELKSDLKRVFYFNAKDELFAENKRISELMNSCPGWSLNESDNSWVFLSGDSSTFIRVDNEMSEINITNTIPGEFNACYAMSEGFALDVADSLYVYSRGEFNNLSRSLGTAVSKFENFEVEGDRIAILTKDKKFAIYDDKLIISDTIEYPLLAHIEGFDIDVLGRIIMLCDDNKRDDKAVICVIENGRYKFLKSPDPESKFKIIRNYYSDSTIMFTNAFGLYRYSEDLQSFYKVYNTADKIAYEWDSYVYDGQLVMSGYGQSVIRIDLSVLKPKNAESIVRTISVENELLANHTELKIEHGKSLTFEVFSFDKNKVSQVFYQYRFNQRDSAWSNAQLNGSFSFYELPAGKYSVSFRAKGETELWGDPVQIEFTIRPPWYHTWWARALYGLTALLLIWLFVRWRISALKKRQEELENEVKIATGEIRTQKAEVEEAHEQLTEKNKEITDSIVYAKRIQEAILPPLKLVKENLEESFILYKPKDIVAGDFYWMETVDDTVIFGAADCTGHGVPGALVSVVCSNALNRAVREFGLTEPAKILDKTLEIVIERFEKSEEEVKDGMDIALCALNTKTNELQYAGANNPLWIVSSHQLSAINGVADSRELKAESLSLHEVKATKQPIGKYWNPKPYVNHTLQLQSGDSVYVFSDGYPDQFGGPHGKKLKSKPFKEFLLSIQDQDMDSQRKSIDDHFENWRADIEQIDDVCVIGVKIS